jgi:amino-acid N-acetyltransferase
MHTARPATQSDQRAITALIHRVGINPFGLHWPRFLVIEEDGVLLACGQLKPHSDCVELASIAVVPERQGRGLGSAIIRALLERHPERLYLTCQRHNLTYYQRFGFERIGWGELPGSFKPVYLIGGVFSAFFKPEHRLTIMRK